jgi:ribosomal protein S18 acetylase RimI-like enzyme
MIEIKFIKTIDTFPIRQSVLRPGKPLTECAFDGDNLDSTKHLGLFVNKEICGITSIYENKNSKFTEQNQSQIRGMAVLKNHQQLGYGVLLMKQAEEYAISKKADLIWFNAREIAIPFYNKLNYLIIEVPFEIGNIGTHYVMYKKL